MCHVRALRICIAKSHNMVACAGMFVSARVRVFELALYRPFGKPGHCHDVRRMTALAPNADFDLRSCDVADVPCVEVSLGL